MEIFGNLWEPVPGNLAWKPLRTLLGNLAWKPCLGTLLGNLAWKPGLGNCLETLLGNLWELAWEPLPGNLGALAIRIFAAPTCSGTFITMLEDPKLTLLGKNVEVLRSRQARWPGQ